MTKPLIELITCNTGDWSVLRLNLGEDYEFHGHVDEKYSECGGKGIHNKTKQKWEVSKKLVSIDKIDRGEDGELRYWKDKDSFFYEMDKYLHFSYQNVLNECKRRNKELEEKGE